MSDSGFIDFDGTPLNPRQLNEKLVRAEFIRVRGDEVKGLESFRQWQRVRDTQGEAEASDFFWSYCYPDFDYEMHFGILDDGDIPQHHHTFERWSQQLDSMEEEDWRKLKAEAEELRKRDRDE